MSLEPQLSLCGRSLLELLRTKALETAILRHICDIVCAITCIVGDSRLIGSSLVSICDRLQAVYPDLATASPAKMHSGQGASGCGSGIIPVTPKRVVSESRPLSESPQSDSTSSSVKDSKCSSSEDGPGAGYQDWDSWDEEWDEDMEEVDRLVREFTEFRGKLSRICESFIAEADKWMTLRDDLGLGSGREDSFQQVEHSLRWKQKNALSWMQDRWQEIENEIEL